jgi:hypothetical protein
MVFLSSRISPLTSIVDRLRQVALGDGGGHPRDLAHLGGEVRGHQVDVLGQLLPRAGDAGHLGLGAELAVDADLARHPGDLGAEAAELLDHAVDRLGVLEELARERPLDAVEVDRLRQVAAGDGGDHLGDLVGVVGQVVQGLVDRADVARPAALRLALAQPPPGAPLAADGVAQLAHVLTHAGDQVGELVEDLRDLAVEALDVVRQADLEFAALERPQAGEELAAGEGVRAVHPRRPGGALAGGLATARPARLGAGRGGLRAPGRGGLLPPAGRGLLRARALRRAGGPLRAGGLLRAAAPRAALGRVARRGAAVGRLRLCHPLFPPQSDFPLKARRRSRGAAGLIR